MITAGLIERSVWLLSNYMSGAYHKDAFPLIEPFYNCTPALQLYFVVFSSVVILIFQAHIYWTGRTSSNKWCQIINANIVDQAGKELGCFQSLVGTNDQAAIWTYSSYIIAVFRHLNPIHVQVGIIPQPVDGDPISRTRTMKGCKSLWKMVKWPA